MDVCPDRSSGRPGWGELDAASSKTDTARTSPMTKRLRSILMTARAFVEGIQAKEGRIIPWVFCQDGGSQLGDYRTAWQTALEKLGIQKLPGRKGPWSNAKVPHDVRRSAIRRMHRQGLDRETVKGMVGHASDSSHAIYAAKSPSPDQLREAALRIDQMRAGEQAEEKVTQLDLFRRRQ